MFQFSSLLTRSDAAAKNARPSRTVSQPDPPPVWPSQTDATAIAATDCVSDRVRRDLDEQMRRLAELLERVESMEFEQEAAVSELLSIAPADSPEEIGSETDRDPAGCVEETSHTSAEPEGPASEAPAGAVASSPSPVVQSDDAPIGDPPISDKSSKPAETPPGPPAVECEIILSDGFCCRPGDLSQRKSEPVSGCTDSSTDHVGPSEYRAPRQFQTRKPPAVPVDLPVSSTPGIVQDLCVAPARSTAPTAAPDCSRDVEPAQEPGCDYPVLLASELPPRQASEEAADESHKCPIGTATASPATEPASAGEPEPEQTCRQGEAVPECAANPTWELASRPECVQDEDGATVAESFCGSAMSDRGIQPFEVRHPSDPTVFQPVAVQVVMADGPPHESATAQPMVASEERAAVDMDSPAAECDEPQRRRVRLRRIASAGPSPAPESMATVSEPPAQRSAGLDTLTWNLLAACGGLLTLAGLLYVVHDLLSWF